VRPAARAEKKAMPKKRTGAAEVRPKAKPVVKSAPKATAKQVVKPTAKPAARVAARRVVVAEPRGRASRSEKRQAEQEMQKFRQLLLAEQARLQAELQEIESRTSRTADAERAAELSSYEDHPADLASETFEREKDLAIGESVQSLLDQVHTALEKVDRGTYGVCDACGRPIRRARLQALPFATLCLDCQDRLEG